MAKSKSRKNQKEKSQKRTQSIRKESVKRLENFQTNISLLLKPKLCVVNNK
jgi:hypothetical protein